MSCDIYTMDSLKLSVTETYADVTQQWEKAIKSGKPVLLRFSSRHNAFDSTVASDKISAVINTGAKRGNSG